MGILFCKWEYENLYNALQICLEKQERVGIFSCLDTYFQRTSDIQSGLKLATSVAQALKSYPAELKENELADQVIIVFGQRASKYLETRQYSQAREAYREVLDTLTSAQSLDEQQKQSWVATTYHQLGRVAQELREFEQARSDYQQALKIKVEFNDRYSQASTYHQLGRVAQELREFEQARSDYQQALKIFVEFNERYEQAGTYHQLGRVAEELREFEQARSDYQQALQIYVEFNDRYEQAGTYGQLGLLAEAEGNPAEARTHLQQALEIFIEFGDDHSATMTQRNLDRLSN